MWKPYDVENAPEIVGQRGQAEFGANLLQPSHQKCTLVHPLLDRAKRVLDGLTTLVEDVGALGYAGPSFNTASSRRDTYGIDWLCIDEFYNPVRRGSVLDLFKPDKFEKTARQMTE